MIRCRSLGRSRREVRVEETADVIGKGDATEAEVERLTGSEGNDEGNDAASEV